MKNAINILVNTSVCNLSESKDLEKLKPFLYGLVLPMAILLLTHSLIAMASIQTLLYFVQSNIQKDRKKARETVKVFIFINILYGTLMIPFIFSS